MMLVFLFLVLPFIEGAVRIVPDQYNVVKTLLDGLGLFLFRFEVLRIWICVKHISTIKRLRNKCFMSDGAQANQ